MEAKKLREDWQSNGSSEADSDSPFSTLANTNATGRAPRRHSRIEEEGDSSWLVSYADLMTLLVGFFVLMQSVSSVDATKFEQIKKATTRVFGGEYEIPFERLSRSLKTVVNEMKLQDQVIFSQSETGIAITFRGALFFESGSTNLRDQAQNLLSELIPIIIGQAKDFGILVEGHTDNVPISTNENIASNWELSSLRSCTVVRLFEEKGFDRTKLKALGWGDTRPILPNFDEGGKAIPGNQAQNRRVVIKILKDFKKD